jgi:hypothetical protein
MRKNNPRSGLPGFPKQPTSPLNPKETAVFKRAVAQSAHYAAHWLKPLLHKGLRPSWLWAASPIYIHMVPSPLGHHVAHKGGLLGSQIGGTET